jgi:hypothetical protein
MQLDALLKFVAIHPDGAHCRIDFPSVPDGALEIFAVPGLLRIRFLVGKQEWLQPVRIAEYNVTASAKKAHRSYVACTLRAPASHWAFARARRVHELSVKVEIERLQRSLFAAEPEEDQSAEFINYRTKHGRAGIRGGGSGTLRGERL